MAESPVIERLMAAVETRLLEITEAEGYLTTIRSVQRRRRGVPSVLPALEIEWAGVRVLGEESYGTDQLENLELGLLIRGYVSNAREAQTAAIDLDRDIRYAMARDRSFGGLCEWSRYDGTAVISAEDATSALAEVQVQWIFRIDTNADDPSMEAA